MTENYLADSVSPTGISGLDEILRGGLPENRLYLLLGAPGVGKTTIALQYLLEGVKRGEPCLYIALSETQSEIMAVARSHGWSLEGLSIFELSALEQQLAEDAQNTVFHPADIELNRTTQLLLDRIGGVKPRRMVLDSLSEFRLMSDSALRYRRQMLSLKQYFSGEQSTVILLDDHSAEGGDRHVQSIAHGVITMEPMVTDYGAEKRRIKINKLRGVDFIGGYHDATIVHGGVQIFPRRVDYRKRINFERTVVPSGIKELDALLGTGLHRGTSALLLGPAGTGKSSIVTQFASESARRKEKVLMCLFEENLDTMIARSASIGIQIEKYLSDELVEVIHVDPAELSPGQFAYMVIDRVRTANVKMVIIDSLNGYMQSMPGATLLNIQMHELLSFLNLQGVLTLLTVAQHGLIGQMQSPVDLTYLADTVILLRYFEQGGRVRKAISVVKKRIGGHEDTIREYKLDGNGIRLGPPLDAFQGILTGTPVFSGTGDKMIDHS